MNRSPICSEKNFEKLKEKINVSEKNKNDD